MKNFYVEIEWHVYLIFQNLYCFFWIIPSTKLLQVKYTKRIASKQGNDKLQSNWEIQKFQCFFQILKSHIDAVFQQILFLRKLNMHTGID